MRRVYFCIAALAAALPAAEVMAHGFAGDRFFPATIATDDPFVADEMSLPTFLNNAHEAMALVGLNASWAHTGRVNDLFPNSISRPLFGM